MIDYYSDLIRATTSQGRALRIRGGGSKDFYGEPTEGQTLDTSVHSGIVDYEPSELYVTARCGTPLATLERELRAHSQMLAFEPPDFGGRGNTTIGGVVASGLSGPRRAYRGAVRDYILGVRMLDGRGDDLRFGGRVMKNVAGYDVSRLVVGSMGTLGLLTEITLKVLPRPQCERTLRFDIDRAIALERMNRWAARPLPLSASAYCDNALWIRLSGAQASVDAACATLSGEVVEGAALWAALRDHTHRFFRDDQHLWRIALPSRAVDLAAFSSFEGEQLIEWGGGLRWLKTEESTVESAADLRDAVARLGGHVTAFRKHSLEVPVFQPVAPVLLDIHRRLKNEFDPHRVFNRGRLYAEL